MAKLPRVLQRIFGSTPGVDDIEQFGSFANGAANYTTNLSTIQSLSNWLVGWRAAIVGSNSPTLEDMNAVHNVVTAQLAYIFENGVPEWETGTTYFAGAIVTDSSANVGATISPLYQPLYISLRANNTGNALTDKNNWQQLPRSGLNPQANPTLAARAVGTWSIGAGAQANPWSAIAYSPELKIFMAVSSSAFGTNRSMSSVDGLTWTPIVDAVADAHFWNALTWSPELGFVALNTSGTFAMVSKNGTSWTAQTVASDTYTGICWSPELGILVGISGNNGIITSPDAITWTSRVSALGAGAGLSGVVWADSLSLFCIVSFDVGAGGGQVQTSPDGVNWTDGAIAGAQWTNICWSKELGLLVAVAESTASRVSYSRDGIIWTTTSTGVATNSWKSVAWSPQLGAFAAVSVDGANRVMTSLDGKSWTAQTAAAANLWVAICWGPQAGKFASVCVGAQPQASKYVGGFVV